MSTTKQVEKIMSLLDENLDDVVTFTTKEMNNPGTCIQKLELILDVLLINWRKFDQLKLDVKLAMNALTIKQEYLRQISYFDMILEKLKTDQLFDQNERLISLSVLLHRPYLKTRIDT